MCGETVAKRNHSLTPELRAHLKGPEICFEILERIGFYKVYVVPPIRETRESQRQDRAALLPCYCS